MHINFFPSVHYVYYLLPSARFLHDDVIRSSAVNLHLTFDLNLPITGVREWSPVRTLGEIQTNRLGATNCLTAALPALMQSHRPRHASAAAGGQCSNFFPRFLIII